METLGLQISFYAYAFATLLTLVIGIVYASRREVMPYHLKALGTTWDEIDPKYQLMLRLFLNGGGWYGISTGLFMTVLLFIPFRNGDTWAGFAIGIIGLIGALSLTLIVHTVKSKTAGNPPLWLMIVICLLLVIGLGGVIL